MAETYSESDFQDSQTLKEDDFMPSNSFAAIGQSLSTPPPLIENFERGMALQPPAQEAGWFSRKANSLGNIIPPVLAGSAGEAVGGPMGAGAAASLARAGQQAVSTGITGKADPFNIGVDVASSGLAQGLAVQYKPEIQAAFSSIASGIKNIASNAYDYLATSKIAGGIAPQAWDFFKNNVQNVISKFGTSPEDADAMANDLRTTISNSVQALEDKYKAGVQALQNSKTPIRIDLDKNLGDPIRNVAQDAGYLDPNRNASSPQAGFFIKNILSRVNDLKSASPMDIYNFQKDLNGYISDNISSNPSLAKSLLQVKDISRLFIEDHPQLKSIAGMNNAWTSAKTVESLAKSTTNSNDLIGYIKRVFNNPQDTLQKRAINDVGAQLPQFAQGVNDIRSYLAAQQVGPLFRGFPATGYGAAVGGAAVFGGQKIAENPYYALAAPALLGLSPRAYAYGYQGALAAAGQASKLLPAMTYAGRAVLQGSLTNYLANPMSEKSVNGRYNPAYRP